MIMIMIYNVAEYLKERKEFKPQEHAIEVDFNLIPLTVGLIQELKDENESHAAMLAFAARKGVSIGRDRVCDDEELAQELADMWCLPQFAELETSLIDQVGKKVCAISGLTEFIENKKLEEETEPDDEANPEVIDGVLVVDGDKPFSEGVSVGELYEDKAAAQEVA